MNIVGVDVRGNLGYCRYDLGPLKGRASNSRSWCRLNGGVFLLFLIFYKNVISKTKHNYHQHIGSESHGVTISMLT